MADVEREITEALALAQDRDFCEFCTDPEDHEENCPYRLLSCALAEIRSLREQHDKARSAIAAALPEPMMDSGASLADAVDRALVLLADLKAAVPPETSNWPCMACGFGHSAVIDQGFERKLIAEKEAAESSAASLRTQEVETLTRERDEWERNAGELFDSRKQINAARVAAEAKLAEVTAALHECLEIMHNIGFQETWERLVPLLAADRKEKQA